jgi:chaperonin cofactor prefoldin
MARVKKKALPSTKEILQLRVEKLERANVRLRSKNKELQRINVETAEALDARGGPPLPSQSMTR